MNKFKKTLMAGVTAGMLMTSTAGMAGGSWLGAGLSAAGTLYSGAMLFFNGGDIVHMLAGNVDAAEILAEALVLYQMTRTEDVWDPEPADEYEKAAENNGGSGGCSGGGGSSGDNGVSVENLSQTLAFVAASLKNVGIEAIGVSPALSDISSAETRTKILGQLGYFQKKNSKSSGSSTTSESNKVPEAGSCEASYSICLKDMTDSQRDEVAVRQKVNEQNFGTAGITHAELGLKAVQQAIAHDGGSSVGKVGTSSSSEKVTIGGTTSVQGLTGLIGTGKNTVAAMKIVALMNLELAQRLNQGNMMQGSTLTVEAARAFPKTAEITD